MDEEAVGSRTRLFLIRHGAVDDAWRGRIYGSLDVPLSGPGMQEARDTAALLAGVDLSWVVSSGLRRAEFGAALLRAGRDLPRCDDPALREIDRGQWAGHRIEELERLHPGAWEEWHRTPGSLRPPGGESLTDLAARVLPRIDHWAATHKGRQIAIVTHGWVIRLLVCSSLGLPAASAPDLDLRTGELVVIDWPALPSTGKPTRPGLASFAADRLPGHGHSS